MTTSSQTESPESFRDTLATIDSKGKRVWVYPTKPKGKFYTGRTIVSYLLLAFLFGAPFVRIEGNPLLLFDILHRQFFIFGLIFWPQDLYLFVLAAITLAVLIILFTAAFGRLFCGWVCPQTVFMEMVFRKIEYLIEGNGPRQRELDHAPMSGIKLFKKALKHTFFLAISFAIGNTFLAYFIGADTLYRIITDSPVNHLSGLFFMILFSLIFYGVFARFREQACTLVCPYGRLQSVLLDSNSIVVAYDFKRGEPRGPIVKSPDHATKGDCIDCLACVKVCPTGIDIRNGTQLECVNCTACIDACDRVMARVNLPLGLIRYSSYNNITHGLRMKFTPRMMLYTAILVVLTIVIAMLMFNRKEVETTVLRATGSLYVELENGSIRNLYTVSVANKTSHELPVELRLKSPHGELAVVGPRLEVKPHGLSESVFDVEIPRRELFTANTLIAIEVLSNGKLIQEIRTTFVGPEPGKSHKENHDEHKH